MRLKIVEFPKTLCESCTEGQVTDFADGTRKVWCDNGMAPHLIDRPVQRCSGYSQKGKMTEYQAREIGWVLESRKSVGFQWTPPKKKE